MAFAAGGRLAAAVTEAGGLGLIGGGYGNAEWIEREFTAAGNTRVGCGFITWSLARQPELLDRVLSHAPAALMLSFGDPAPFAPAIRRAGSVLICQVQTLPHARQALAAGAEIIVAQGTEAGGHGGSRATLTLTPEIADLLARESPDTLLVSAGGIADGRGLAAVLMLGADGVLVGSRLWASEEALVVQITIGLRSRQAAMIPSASALLTLSGSIRGRMSSPGVCCATPSLRAGPVARTNSGNKPRP